MSAPRDKSETAPVRFCLIGAVFGWAEIAVTTCVYDVVLLRIKSSSKTGLKHAIVRLTGLAFRSKVYAIKENYPVRAGWLWV